MLKFVDYHIVFQEVPDEVERLAVFVRETTNNQDCKKLFDNKALFIRNIRRFKKVIIGKYRELL